MAAELKALVDGLELLDGDEVAVVARRVVAFSRIARDASPHGDERQHGDCHL